MDIHISVTNGKGKEDLKAFIDYLNERGCLREGFHYEKIIEEYKYRE